MKGLFLLPLLLLGAGIAGQRDKAAHINAAVSPVHARPGNRLLREYAGAQAHNALPEPTLAARQDSATLVDITPLKGSTYLYITYGKPDEKTFYPANAVFIVSSVGIVLLDTPWNNEQTDTLVNLLETRYGQKVVACISTHWHEDRVGGVKALQARGIATWSSAQTAALCRAQGKPAPAYTFTKDTIFHFGQETLETFYPGPGHTLDNITVWLPREKLLFAGCFLKSGVARSIGYTADGDVKAWPASVRRLQQRYPKAQIVVPGHESLAGNAFANTILLAEQAGKH